MFTASQLKDLLWICDDSEDVTALLEKRLRGADVSERKLAIAQVRATASRMLGAAAAPAPGPVNTAQLGVKLEPADGAHGAHQHLAADEHQQPAKQRGHDAGHGPDRPRGHRRRK